MAPNVRVFLSYSSKAGDWVRVLGRNLERAGFRVFVDEKDIRPGQPWWTRLQQGVTKADKLVLVVTPEAMASPWVGQEVAAFASACAEKVRAGALVPVLLAGAPLPPFVEAPQAVDFRDPGMTEANADHESRDAILTRLLSAEAEPLRKAL